MKIAVIGNYPPRKCGIATFTENFIQSLFSVQKSHPQIDLQIEVFAMNDQDEGYPYPDIVKMGIRQHEMSDYEAAIDYINNHGFDYCHIQHEYGIFGGVSGIYVMQFLAKIHIPIAVTLHTVLKEPDFYQRQILYAMGIVANKIFVMSQLATHFLKDIYKISEDKIKVIEHGTPVFKEGKKEDAKRKLDWENRMSILTFGLLGRSKGIETAIRALPEVVKQNPNVVYTILGKTHPHVVEHEGESYRKSLQTLAKDLQIADHVEFLDQYATEEDLSSHLSAADIYITPYLNENQITSGTLCYAVASGAAVVSTPYWHASELLANDRGLLFPFNNSEALSKQLQKLVTDPRLLKKYQDAAFTYGQSITWPKIGEAYYQVIAELVTEKDNHAIDINEILLSCEPQLSTIHLDRLTDDFGLLQHARYIFPNYEQGYCTDDNARALLFATMHYEQTKSQKDLSYIDKFLSFLNFTKNNNNSYVNLLDYSRSKLEEVGSEDAFGRSVWALGYLASHAPNNMYKEFAIELFSSSIGLFTSLKSLRGVANTIIGMSWYLQTNPHHQEVKDHLFQLSVHLYNAYTTNKTGEWHWYEDLLSYDNGILPLALLHAGESLKKPIFIDTAIESLRFLEKATLIDGKLSLIGNEEWWRRGEERSKFSQQAIDTMSMALAAQKAFEITKQQQHLKTIKSCYTWFLGNNDVYVPLYDEETKGCGDGLHRYGVNRNQGAESLLSWLITYLVFHQTKASQS